MQQMCTDFARGFAKLFHHGTMYACEHGVLDAAALARGQLCRTRKHCQNDKATVFEVVATSCLPPQLPSTKSRTCQYYQNGSSLPIPSCPRTGIGGLKNTSTPTGAHTLRCMSPLIPGENTVTHPGSPDIAMSAMAPASLVTRMTCKENSDVRIGLITICITMPDIALASRHDNAMFGNASDHPIRPSPSGCPLQCD